MNNQRLWKQFCGSIKHKVADNCYVIISGKNMNTRNLDQIINHYIEKFEIINGSVHQEYYKWEIAKAFKPMMDTALASSDEIFSEKLMEVKRLTYNLIDSYTQPFYGLVKFAEEEPQTVRDMFLDLYSGDASDLADKQERIGTFLERSHALRDKYYPESYLYKDDMHSATAYLFLYDPDNNYLFKASHALRFADCIEFYEDWGAGDNVKLDVYYRMCDQLVAYIKSDEALMRTDESRFEGGWGPDPKTLHNDTEKHILAFDLIYCCSTYGLFEGISFDRPNTKEKQLLLEKKKIAHQYAEAFEEAKQAFAELEAAYDYLNTVYDIGKELIHKHVGRGIVTNNGRTDITVEFPDGSTKRLGTKVAALNGIVKSEEDDYKERLTEIRPILDSEDRIRTRLSVAEKKFAEYVDFLD